MQEFETKLATRLLGKFSDENLKYILDEVQKLHAEYEIKPRPKEIACLEDVIPISYKAFMVAKKVEGKSVETLKAYSLILENMLSTINKPVEEITSNDLRVYLYDYQSKHEVTNRTLECKRLVMSSYFGWAYKEGYLPENPCANIAPIKYDSVPRNPLSDIELELVRIACCTLRERAIIEVLYSTGCRVSELIRLSKKDINLQNGSVELFGKGSKRRTGYLSARAIVALNQYLNSRSDTDEAVFVRERQPYSRLGKEAVEKIVRQIGERAGIGRRLYPHLLRHTMATDFLDRSGNVTELKNLLGHEKLDTTMIYAKINTSSVEMSHRRYIV